MIHAGYTVILQSKREERVEVLEQGEEFRNIRTRIRRTLSLPIDDTAKSTGAPTNPRKYVNVCATTEPKDDLVDIFRRMLYYGDSNYQHDLTTFLHNGPPKMRYEYNKETDSWTDNAGPITKAREAKYFEERSRK